MIRLYETGGCLSCRKAKAWLEENGISYRAMNIQNRTLSVQELKHLFSLATDIYEVISKRSTPVATFKKTHGFDIEEFSFNKLIEFLQQNPTAMKRPLITNGKILVSGYDEDEITALLPREKRNLWTARVEL
ncbi:Spx/MgsR family RNA polymerase-binding regulatory protein [Ileibacterium valens]|uniref:Spx/MgsR family RNA polymerase-binding regulatory protein n=1 Tax=Ileibacterium valens TaxID=1862668 RepID=UPI00272A9944|nr:Spx/MgsR family RNA polymerase-binding regulatory protein [Ileibacterium valens]